MADIKNIPVDTQATEVPADSKNEALVQNDDDLVIQFVNPVKWEGTEYKDIDLTGLRDLTGQDLIDAERAWYVSGGRGADQPELGYQSIAILCARKSDKPIEFFLALPILEARLVRNSVRNFLRGLA